MEQLLRLTSHELKTPIAGVRALLQSLELGSVPPEQQKLLTQMGIAECDRLEHLAETVLAYQRAVVREQKDLEVHGAAQLVDEVLEHRQRTRVQETVVKSELASATVRVDRDAFRVIFENLLDNARKYGGGQSEVRARLDGRRWQLEVSDKGQGFPPQDAERIFDPFKREKTTSVNHGSGLGLSIARQLARQMGGDLTAKSGGPQTGATFVLALPVVPPQASARS
jgi:signal transduction histidine kinase